MFPAARLVSLSHFLNPSVLPQWFWGHSGLHKPLPLPLQKAAGLMFPFPFVHRGGAGGRGPFMEKKGCVLSREHPLVNVASSQSPRWHWSCTDPGDAWAGVVPVASLTSRGSKPTPAAGAELELGEKMICKHPAPLHEALKAVPFTQEQKSSLGGKTSDNFPVPTCPLLSLPITNRKTG